MPGVFLTDPCGTACLLAVLGSDGLGRTTQGPTGRVPGRPVWDGGELRNPLEIDIRHMHRNLCFGSCVLTSSVFLDAAGFGSTIVGQQTFRDQTAQIEG